MQETRWSLSKPSRLEFRQLVTVKFPSIRGVLMTRCQVLDGDFRRIKACAAYQDKLEEHDTIGLSLSLYLST